MILDILPQIRDPRTNRHKWVEDRPNFHRSTVLESQGGPSIPYSDNLCPQNQEMPYEVVWSTDSSLIGRKRGVQRDFVPTVKPVYTYATRKSAVETPSSRTHRVGSEKVNPGESHQRSTDAKITNSTGQDLKFDGTMCSLKEGFKQCSE